VASKRKTNADRQRERDEADRRAWDVFRPKLDALQTYAEAMELAAKRPRPDEPGRRYYSNLDFFLGSFIVPMGTSHTEKALYLQFIERLDVAGALKAGAGQKVAEELRQAMKVQGPW
jgi:hypothetical protein